MTMASTRRLGAVQAHLAAAATVGAGAAAAADAQWARPQQELHHVPPLPAADPELLRALNVGRLNPSGLPAETVRSMMRPEPTQPSETEANMSGFMPYHGMTRHNMGHPKIDLPALWDDATGGVSMSALETCRKLQHAAAHREDYETATIIQNLIKVIEPQPHRTALDCAPIGAEAKAEFFYQNGFVVLEQVIAPDALAKLQAAWMHIESQELPKWEEAR